MEKLADALGDVLSEPAADPFSAECILVPGRGVAQWLNMRLCERFGVWANALYLYPRNFVGWALDRVLSKPGEALEAVDPERLLWSVFSTLKPLLEGAEFETIRRYVAADPTEVRYFELCRRIAYTFDRYATYRPDMLQGWERRRTTDRDGLAASQLALFSGSRDPQAWQPILWRALSERLGPVHATALERRFVRSLQQTKRLQNLPGRICCLGVTHLPPSYTRILVALCPHVPVHMFQLRASEPREATPGAGERGPARRQSAVGSAGAEGRGNPLCQSLGALATEFDSVLERELSSHEVTTRAAELYEIPSGTTRLTRLQREILENRAPVGADLGLAAPEADESIRIHVCHSPMREVEVVHDQLLALLSTDTHLEPRDVVVMMPDVEIYAPLIEAVFRRGPDDPAKIPYSIADRSVQTSAPVVEALERLFALASQRLSLPQVLDLLALDVVAARFEITPRDLERMTLWLTKANVRWGMDAGHRASHGHPDSDHNSWRFGLLRLLLGYAVDSQAPALVFDVLPLAGAEGSEAAALGKLCAFVEALFSHLVTLGKAHPPADWPAVVGAALDALCVNDEETAWQHQALREGLSGLAGNAKAAAYAEPIVGSAYRELLFEAVNAARPARGFLMGGVTFCSMVPLRTIPFRVVCMLGLGDGQLPRKELSTDFDLIMHGPEGRRTGDRSRRSEDRYLFLEAILSARERLIITYTGQSIRDNAALPPSVLVNELCDYLAAGRGSSRDESLSNVIVRHPLQAFSSRYFDRSDARLFSYAEHYVNGAEAPGQSAPPEFFAAALPAPPPSEVLAVGDLVRFYQNPTAHLLNRRLELFLRERDLDVPDREPQELSPLDKYTSGSELLELMLQGLPSSEAKHLIMASGALPLGAPGELDFLEIEASSSAIAAQVLLARKGPKEPPLSVGQRLPGGRKLIGLLPEAYGGGLLAYQFARIRAKHLVALWIRHLVYCWQSPAGARAQSRLIGRPREGDGVVRHELRAVEDPATHLQALVRRYDEGQLFPLWLFPSSSLFYVEQQGKKPKAGLDPRVLVQREWRREVQEDAHLRRVFGADRQLSDLRPTSPGQAAFEELAGEVFGPLLEHLVTSSEDA